MSLATPPAEPPQPLPAAAQPVVITVDGDEFTSDEEGEICLGPRVEVVTSSDEDDVDETDFVDVDALFEEEVAQEAELAKKRAEEDVQVAHKRQDYTVIQKLKLLKMCSGKDSGKNWQAERRKFQVKLSRKHPLRPSQLQEWRNQEQALMQMKKKRSRVSTFGRNTKAPELEEAVFKRLRNLIEKNGLTKKSMKREVREAGRNHQLKHFGEKSHLKRFRRRYGLHSVNAQRVTKLSVEEAIQRFRDFHAELWHVWEENPDLQEEDVFNADEASLTVSGQMVRRHQVVYIKDQEGNIVGNPDGGVRHTVLDETKRIGTFFPFWGPPTVDCPPFLWCLYNVECSKAQVESQVPACKIGVTAKAFTTTDFLLNDLLPEWRKFRPGKKKLLILDHCTSHEVDRVKKLYFFTVPSYWLQHLVERIMENATLAAPDPIFLTTSISTRFSWRHSVTGAHDMYRNVYASGTFPHPLDTRFTLVQKFRHTSIAAKTAGALDSMTPDDDTKSPQSLEGYITGRFIYEALTRVPAGTPITGSSVADTAFKTKLFDIDDVTVGPFIRSCIGHRTAAAKTCWCNTGGRSVFMTKVSGETGHSEPVVDNATMFEHEAAQGVIPLGECAFPPTFPLPSKNVVLVFNAAMASAEPELADAASAVISAASSSIFDARVNGELATLQVHPARVTTSSTANTLQRDIASIVDDRYEALLLLGCMFPSFLSPSPRSADAKAGDARPQSVVSSTNHQVPLAPEAERSGAQKHFSTPGPARPHTILSAGKLRNESTQHNQGDKTVAAMRSVLTKLSVPTVAAVSSLEWLERDPNTMPFDKFAPNVIPFWPTLSDLAHTAAAYIAELEVQPTLSANVDVLPSSQDMISAPAPWNKTAVKPTPGNASDSRRNVRSPATESETTARLRALEAVHIVADTPSLANLATRSVETHLERPPSSVSVLPAASEVPIPFGHASPTAGSLILITQRRDVVATINERCVAASRQSSGASTSQLKVFLATSEFLLDLYRPSAIDEAAGTFRNSTGASVPIPENLFFLSGLPGYLNGTRAATHYGEALGAFAVRVAITAGVARGKPVETEAMVASLYSSGSVLAGRVTIQPLSMTPCAHTIPAEGVFPHPTTGRCQCNKGLNTFHVIRAANASHSVFSYSHDFCGVSYRALPTPQHSDNSLSSTAVLAIACGSVIALGVACAVVAALLAFWARYRRTRFCPTDPIKPFAALFVTLRNEAALRERHPTAVDGVLQSLSEIAVRSAAAHRCHIAQRLDAHFLIVACDPSDAMRCACDVVRTIEHTAWGQMISTKTGAAVNHRSDGSSSRSISDGPPDGLKYRRASRTTTATAGRTGNGRQPPSAMWSQSSAAFPPPPEGSVGSASVEDVPSMSVRSVASSRSPADDFIAAGGAHTCRNSAQSLTPRRRNRSPAPDLKESAGTLGETDTTQRQSSGTHAATAHRWNRHGKRDQSVIIPLVSVGLSFGYGKIVRDEIEQLYRYRGDVVDAAAVIADTARPGQLLAAEAAVESSKGQHFGDAEEFCARQLSSLGTNPRGVTCPKSDRTVQDTKQATSHSSTLSAAVTLMQVTPVGCAVKEFAAPTSDDGAGGGDTVAGTLAAALETAAGCLTTRRIAVVCVSVPALRNPSAFMTRSDHAAQCEATYRAVMAVAKGGSHDVVSAMDGQLCIAVNARVAKTAQIAMTAASIARTVITEVEDATRLRARAGVAVGPATVGLCDGAVVAVGTVGERARLLAAVADAHDADPSIVTAAEMAQDLEVHFEICAIDIIAWPRQCQRPQPSRSSESASLRTSAAPVASVDEPEQSARRDHRSDSQETNHLTVIYSADAEIAITDDGEEEWLYQLEHVSAKNPHSDRNTAFAALLQPRSPQPPSQESIDSTHHCHNGFESAQMNRTSLLPLVPAAPSSPSFALVGILGNFEGTEASNTPSSAQNPLHLSAQHRLRTLSEAVEGATSTGHQRQLLARSAELRVTSLCFPFALSETCGGAA